MFYRGRKSFATWASLIATALGLGFAFAPQSGHAIIGFKVRGWCLIGCGSDSAISKAAADVGAGFADKAIANFGVEGRKVVDYADTKAQTRLAELSESLTSLKNEAITGLSTQRQVFIADINQQAEALGSDVAAYGRQFITDASVAAGIRINQVDASMRESVSYLSVSIYTVAGVFVGLLFAFFLLLAPALRKRQQPTPIQLARAAGLIAVGAISGGMLATLANSRIASRYAETNQTKLFREIQATDLTKPRYTRIA